MKSRMAKLDRLAARINAEYQEQRDGTDSLLSLIARCMLHHQPDLRLVTEADTDAGTFADIQSTLAYARDDWAAARAWKARIPPEPPLPRKPGEPDRAYHTRVIAQICKDSKSTPSSTDLAIAAARKRRRTVPQGKNKAATR